MIAGFIHLVWKIIWNAVLVLVCSGLIFIGYKANQPMSVAGAPKGMTYVEFIQTGLMHPKRSWFPRIRIFFPCSNSVNKSKLLLFPKEKLPR